MHYHTLSKPGFHSHITSSCKQPRREKRKRYTKIINTLHIYLWVNPFHWMEFQNGRRLKEILVSFCREQACLLCPCMSQELALHLAPSSAQALRCFTAGPLPTCQSLLHRLFSLKKSTLPSGELIYIRITCHSIFPKIIRSCTYVALQLSKNISVFYDFNKMKYTFSFQVTSPNTEVWAAQG